VRAHIGPGHEYRRVEGRSFSRGESLGILDERDGWTRVKVPAANEPCWIPKYLSFPLDELNRDTLQNDLLQLRRVGFVSNVNAEENMADVDLAIWLGTEPRLRMGVARTLAAYCAAQRGNKLVFVTIRDTETGKKLGKYGQGLGWKDAEL
jgi:hypothetical protein